jgi:SAM-dependent methyltransferase
MPVNSAGDASAAVDAPPDAFRFGRNWQRYVSRYLDSDREHVAAQSLHDLAGDLRGRTFIDVGCGSGLFSLCAYRAGARAVISLDVDPDSVATTCQLHTRSGSPVNWRVIRGSILNLALIETLEAADVVYSWGVLHHTGDMYTAIRNAGSLVKPGGQFVIAIYRRIDDRWLSSERWLRIKRAYNHAPRIVQLAMELTYAAYWLLGRLWRRQNPVRIAREYRKSRGMALWSDLVDWLGGYPYEYATVEEITDFCRASLGMTPLKIVPGDSNNQFVFERPLASQ